MFLNSHIYEKMTHLVFWVPDCVTLWGTCHPTGGGGGLYYPEAPLTEIGNKKLGREGGSHGNQSLVLRTLWTFVAERNWKANRCPNQLD